MQALSIELEDETVDALEVERELFGFESRQAYVRWIIANRDSIEAASDGERDRDHEAEQDRLLAEHGERLARLESRVATLEAAVDRDDGDAARESGDGHVDETETAEETGDAEVTGAADGTDSNGAGSGTDGTARSRSGSSERRDPSGAATTTADRESLIEVRGAPRTVRQGPDSKIRADDASSTASGDGDADSNSSSNADSSPETAPERDERSDGASTSDSSSLAPERVARIPEDPVHEDAGVLGNVESERLDELSRRAVATTRKRLNRDVQTGLEYTSSTRLAGDGVRPGEDVTDLDALSIPGRSEETLEKRRHAVGRALAYLRDEGRARRSDFVDALYEECPAGYDTTDGWWRCIKEGLKQVDAVEGGEGTRVWRYRG